MLQVFRARVSASRIPATRHDLETPRSSHPLSYPTATPTTYSLFTLADIFRRYLSATFFVGDICRRCWRMDVADLGNVCSDWSAHSTVKDPQYDEMSVTNISDDCFRRQQMLPTFLWYWQQMSATFVGKCEHDGYPRFCANVSVYRWSRTVLPAAAVRRRPSRRHRHQRRLANWAPTTSNW